MNHFRIRTDLTEAVFRALEDIPFPSLDAERPVDMLKKCPRASETPLAMSSALADRCAVNEVWVKDERDRMGLGSFKALGAAYVIARDAEAGLASERTYVTASAGNHGLSLAAGASAFGSRAVIYLADTVPPSFAERLKSLGAEVKRAGSTYELSMEAAARDAERNGWTLLSDSSWKGYVDRPWVLMEGYLTLAREIVDQMDVVPTHVFLQAGVGGLAASAAAYLRRAWGEAPRIVVVEPEVAPALFASMLAGAPKVSGGPVSDMGRLDCKEPSLIALKGLARDASDFMTITEEEGFAGAKACAVSGFPTTPSGAAGVAGLISAASAKADLGLEASSRVVVILSEEAEN